MKVLVAVLLFLILTGASAVTAEEFTYVVQPGDTLFDIARNYDFCWETLAEENSIYDPSLLRIGTVLVLPGGPDWEQGGAFDNYSEDELVLLARLIQAEARGESLEGQIAVGAVVLNRVKSDDFPNSVTAVIRQPGQFSPVANNRLPNTPNSQSIKAAQRALTGEDPTRGALFFYNPQVTRNPSFWQTRRVLRSIGNHNFAI